MRKSMFKASLVIVGLASGTLLFNSCSEPEKKESKKNGIEIDNDYYEFQTFDLSGYGINAYISLPDETANIGASTKPEVIHTPDDIYWQINVGQNFSLNIEDYAAMTDRVKEEKKQLAEKKFFKVKYLVDEPDLIVYERNLVVQGTENASPRVGFEHKSYHVYGEKVIDGITYVLESREEGYEKVIIELMAKSIRSFKPKKAS